MTTPVLVVNIVLAAFAVAGIVGSLSWSIAQGRTTNVERL